MLMLVVVGLSGILLVPSIASGLDLAQAEVELARPLLGLGHPV